MLNLLKNKVAVVYGGAGSLGAGVAKAYADAGARVFLVGRTESTLRKVAEETGAEYDVLDARDEAAVEAHAASVVERAGRIDISLNLVPRGDFQGVPLTEMSVEDYTRPVVQGIACQFVTARAAARRMTAQGSGVILSLDSGSANGSPMMGGTAAADGAIDALIRQLAAELGPSGVRVCGIWTAGVTDTLTPQKLTAAGAPAMDETAVQGIRAHLDSLRMTRRSPQIADIAALATFLASDAGVTITGTWINATAGMFAS
ncbi:NAD(P)-dependent dehydrogenase (short-subunit alcohol dehydrogenase family) [Streptomyces canus]|uniref:SDR family NAD(P)-dependent oxidoreductase n=1 Tax=Streptomyces canus TaxID=58343 RepID=UPI00278AE2CD|nr:SDR family oxidoreductase [Streptomyces canus]MDQ0600706.1 NAD(P)-dependent dehydrogenase (short-subunit alcohol dehydrogenase family) [Streptomyces canus]